MGKKISFAITVHNETTELKRLLARLWERLSADRHEIVLLDDFSTHPETCALIDEAKKRGVSLHQRAFRGDFAEHKNYLKSKCSGEYIFSLDADELPSENLLYHLDTILEEGGEAFAISRLNTVEGITEEHVAKWKWSITDSGWINWPDWQIRLFQNKKGIEWRGAVHERISGFQSFVYLPSDELFAIHHPKKISRQEDQNRFYEELIEREFERARKFSS